MFKWARTLFESLTLSKHGGRAPKGAFNLPVDQLVQGSYPSSGLTPHSLASYLKSADVGMVEEQAKLIQEMIEKDCHFGGLVTSRKTAVTQLDYKIMPFDNQPESATVAKFVEDAVYKNLSFDDLMETLLDGIFYGYSFAELIWDLDQDNKSVIVDVKPIHPKLIRFYRGETFLAIQGELTKLKDFKTAKFFPNHSLYPSRSGVGRACTWVYLWKMWAVAFWNRYNEVYGMPVRLGRYSGGASQEDKDALVTALKSLGTDAAGVISEQTSIEFVEAAVRNAGAANPYESLIEFCNREMSKRVVGQTLTTDSGVSSGSFALGQIHAQVREDIVKADAARLAYFLRKTVFYPLTAFNFGPNVPVPFIKFKFENSSELLMKGQIIQGLSNSGWNFDDLELSEMFGLTIKRTQNDGKSKA
jgi:phage gp29-like protein